MCEHVLRRHDSHVVCGLIVASYTLAQSSRWPACEIPLGLLSSPHFSTPLPPLLLLSSSHSLLPPPPREEKTCHSLTADWHTNRWIIRRLWPWPWRLLHKRWGRRKSQKLESNWWYSLRMFRRCGGMWTLLSVHSLPLSHSLSSSTWLLSEPTASASEIQDTTPSLVFFPYFVRESLFVRTRWELTEKEEKHLHCLTELRRFLKAPKEPWEGIGAFPDTFGMPLFLWSQQGMLCFVLFVLTRIWSCWGVVVLLCNCSVSLLPVVFIDDFFTLFFCQHVKIRLSALSLNLTPGWET